MRKLSIIFVTVCLAALTAARTPWKTAPADVVIKVEQAALDRWGKGDPTGFLETYAPEITYFDPMLPRRIDGHAVMEDYLRPLTGKIKVSHYEMIGAKVQRHGDAAVLTYNLLSEGV